MIREILGYFHLARSLFYLKKGDNQDARIQLDSAKKKVSKEVDFIDAYDARLLVTEGQHEKAERKFREVIERYSRSDYIDENYIEKYCQFFIALYEKDIKARDFKAEALSLGARSNVIRFLPFLPDEAIDRILCASVN